MTLNSPFLALLAILPNWNSLDSVKQAHSYLELAGLVFFALLVLAEALAHNSQNEKRKHLFDSIGIWFFAIAILCEIAGYWYGQRNDALSEQVISSLDVKAKQAFDNASNALTKSGEAVKSAKAAHDEADATIASTKKVEGQVHTVSAKAGDIDDRLGLALSLVAQRSILHPKETADRLASLFDRRELITLRSYKGDVEGFNLCMQLYFLMLPKLTPIAGCGQDELTTEPRSMSESPMPGMFIKGPDVYRGVGLRLILLDDGGMGIVRDINGQHIQPNWELEIGVNPAFSMERLEAAEAARKQRTEKTKPKP